MERTMRQVCCILARAGVMVAAQTSTSKATQAGQTTPKTARPNAQDDQSGTTGSNTGLPAGAGSTSAAATGAPKGSERGVSRKHRKHLASQRAHPGTVNER